MSMCVCVYNSTPDSGIDKEPPPPSMPYPTHSCFTWLISPCTCNTTVLAFLLDAPKNVFPVVGTLEWASGLPLRKEKRRTF